MAGANEDPLVVCIGVGAGVAVAESLHVERVSLLGSRIPAKEDDSDENGTAEKSEN